MKHTKKRLPRQSILILSHADGFLEAYGDRNIDVHIVRVPVAYSLQDERTAEDVAELLMPRRYHDLYRADRLRGTGTTRPLLPSILADSAQAKKDIATINALSAYAPAEEVIAWTF